MNTTKHYVYNGLYVRAVIDVRQWAVCAPVPVDLDEWSNISEALMSDMPVMRWEKRKGQMM